MKLSDCNFSEKDIKQLQNYRDSQKDIRLKLRFMAILSIAYYTGDIEAGIRHTAEIFGKHTETIKNWLRRYLSEGIEALNSFNYKPKQSYLNRHQINQVIIFVTYENPATAAVRKLLIKNRLKVIRPRTVPGNPPSPEDQKKLLKNIIR